MDNIAAGITIREKKNKKKKGLRDYSKWKKKCWKGDQRIVDDDDVINTSRIWERQVQIATSRASEFFWSFFKNIFGTIIPSFQQAQIWNLRIKHEFSLFAY